MGDQDGFDGLVGCSSVASIMRCQEVWAICKQATSELLSFDDFGKISIFT